MRYQKIRKPIVIFNAVLFHSLLVFHLLFSPVIIVLASGKGILNASFFSFILIFALSLFFGRAYCGWFCPGCGLQELAAFAVKKKTRNTKARYIKYVIFTVWIAVIAVGYILKGFTKIDLSFGMTDISMEKKLILTFGAVIIIVPLVFILGKFASCKYICWQAPFMIIGNRIRNTLRLPGLRITADAAKCKNCGACAKACPMNLDMIKITADKEIKDDECILCGNCIDACRFNALTYRICVPEPKQTTQDKTIDV